MDKKIVILGCGRSGTQYICRVFGQAGLAVGHERPNRDGVANWYAVPERMHIVASRNGEPVLLSESTILHQVRFPLHVISSFRIAGARSWKWVYECVPQINKDMPLILRCMLYWKHWNLMAEKRAEWTYRVEVLFEPAIFEEFCRRTGASPEHKSKMMKVSRTSHHRTGRKVGMGVEVPLTLADLEATDAGLLAEILKQAKRYGYEI